MADFTDQDKELLDKLRKAFETKGKTRLALDPWQEALDRDTSVPAQRAILAAKIVEGFAGSWAAQYNFGWGSTAQAFTAPVEPLSEPDPEGPPVPIRAKTNHIGSRGVPEVNFVPYNWRTNSFGSKGPALVGHPISFEVVGSTLKSPWTEWTWQVVQGGGPNGGDLLTPDVRPDGSVSPIVGLISDMYGPAINGTWTLGDLAEPNGGLYLIVSDDGANAGALAVGQTPMGALPSYVDSARYELFRVSEVTATAIEIHPNKSFALFFDLPVASTRHIRGITIVKPYVARLLAIPQSGAPGGNDGVSVSGREQTFVVVSPDRSAGNDNFPPYLGAGGVGVGDGTWLGGGFSEARAPGSVSAVGATDAYGGKFRLPIPRPVVEVVGTVEQSIAPLPTADIGQWLIELSSTALFTSSPFSPTNLPITRISATTRNDDLPALTFGSVGSCLGWFDVFDTQVGPIGVVLNRVPETSPTSGLTYWGPGPYVSSIAAPSVSVGMTLHLAVDTLWQTAIFDVDKVEASRIKNIIDPQWASRFEKQLSDPTLAGGQSPPPGGSGSGRPDKAIFATETFPGALPRAANPGNFMDLGFRMVLFPAKEDPNDPTQAIANFDLPIYGRGLIIDGSIQEQQYFDVDYSAGIVRLSHPPPTSRSGIPDAPSDIIPNGIQGTGGNNPRGEVILFAACVPYSMEDSQVGTGSRITVHHGDGRDRDVASDQFEASIEQTETSFIAVPPYFGPSAILPNPVEIVLDRLWEGPETGVVTITRGNNDTPAFGRWGYMSTRTVTTTSGAVVTALGGLSVQPGVFDPTPASTADPRSLVLRREVNFYAQSLDLPSLTDTYIADTTYGSSLRSNILRMRDHEIVHNIDGSVTVESRAPGYMWHQAGEWSASGVRDSVPFVERLDEGGVLAGVYYQNQTDFDDTSNGVTDSNFGGQFTSFESLAGLNDFAGVVTRKALIRLSHNMRLVIKFSFNHAFGSTLFNGFVGLIGPADLSGPPPLTSLVNFAASSPTNALCDYLGLRIDGLIPTVSAEFYAQRNGLPGAAISRPSGATVGSLITQAHFLVIETEPYFDSGVGIPFDAADGELPSFVKIALFDEQFREVGRTRFYNQDAVPRGPLELVIATKNLEGAGRREVALFNAKIVNAIDLPFLTIP